MVQTAMLTENKVICDFVGSPLLVQIGFCKAAEMGYKKALRKQLARGAKKNGANHQCDTAILLAAASGQIEIVRILLKWGVALDEWSHATWDFGTIPCTWPRRVATPRWSTFCSRRVPKTSCPSAPTKASFRASS